MTNDEIIQKNFSRAFRGYDIQEVDAFLDEIVRELELREQAYQMLGMRVKMLTDEVNWLNARIAAMNALLEEKDR